jgi:hypothetical protein
MEPRCSRITDVDYIVSRGRMAEEFGRALLIIPSLAWKDRNTMNILNHYSRSRPKWTKLPGFDSQQE